MWLNLSLKRISYFPANRVLAYEVDLNEVSQAMANAPKDLEQICYQLAGCEETKEGDEHLSAIEKMGRITRRIKRILSQHSKGDRRITWDPHDIKKECNCSTDDALEERVRLHFSNAYIEDRT
jgi:hypothetical protein